MAANTTDNIRDDAPKTALSPEVAAEVEKELQPPDTIISLGTAADSAEAITPDPGTDRDVTYPVGPVKVEEFNDNEEPGDDPLGDEFQTRSIPEATVTVDQFVKLLGRRRTDGVDGCERIAPQRWRHPSGLILDASGTVIGRS